MNSEPLIGGITLDITKEKNAEAALRQSEAQQRAILSALPDIMFRFSADGTFLEYHAPEEELLLSPPEIFLGKRARDVLPTELASSLESRIVEVINTRQIALTEYSLPVRSDATGVHEYEGRLVPLGDNEVLSIIRDVTERKLAERELKAL